MQHEAVASAHRCNKTTRLGHSDANAYMLVPAQPSTSTEALGRREQRQPSEPFSYGFHVFTGIFRACRIFLRVWESPTDLCLMRNTTALCAIAEVHSPGH